MVVLRFWAFLSELACRIYSGGCFVILYKANIGFGGAGVGGGVCSIVMNCGFMVSCFF